MASSANLSAGRRSITLGGAFARRGRLEARVLLDADLLAESQIVVRQGNLFYVWWNVGSEGERAGKVPGR